SPANAKGSPQADSTQAKSAQPSLVPVDQQFVTTAAEAGAAEVEMGKLAETHGSSSAVKDFGKRMASDHERAGDELQSIASKKGVKASEQLSKKDRDAVDKLTKLQGAEFDKAYIQAQLTAHKDAVSLFEKESKSGKDTDLKQYATNTLPTLKEHLNSIEKLAKS